MNVLLEGVGEGDVEDGDCDTVKQVKEGEQETPEVADNTGAEVLLIKPDVEE